MPADIVSAPAYARFLRRMDGLRSAGVMLGLERVRAALERLGHPERQVAFVQIAGTNGKGSTAAMVDAIARAAGVRTGLFTSPHLVRFTERLKLQGVEVEPERLDPVLERVLATAVPLTYFEAATLVSVCVMAESGTELGVMETGLGGRLDAVTALPVVATAITSIGEDHLDILGPTLEDVAGEKAAIARPGVPLFVAQLAPPLLIVVERVAAAAGAPVVRVHQPRLTALQGPHQGRNAGVAWAVGQAALGALGRPRSDALIQRGLQSVVWPGRLERVGNVLLDCAHNPEGARALAVALAEMAAAKVILVLSMVSGKDVHGVIAALASRLDTVVVTQCASERALPARELASLVAPALGVTVVPVPEEALAHAQALAGHNGLVVVAGSTFLVGQIRAHLLGEAIDPVATSDPMPRL